MAQVHALAFHLGKEHVSTHMPERRPTAAELAAMDVWERAAAEASIRESDEEKYARLRMEVLDLDQLSFSEQQEPPDDWGR